jgi:chromosome segregation ATPase
MISKRFIDQGIKIREDFLNVNKKLNLILDDIKRTANKMEEFKNDFVEISENMEDFPDLETAKKTLLDKLTQADAESKRLAKVYEPINRELESLKQQEESLYRNIKETYPELSDDEIVSEFEPHIEKLKN